jgi:hypothetical protein
VAALLYTLKWGVKKIAFIIDCYVPTPLNLSRRIENPESSRGGKFEPDKQHQLATIIVYSFPRDLLMTISVSPFRMYLMSPFSYFSFGTGYPYRRGKAHTP